MKKSQKPALALLTKISEDDLKKLSFNHHYWESNAKKFKTGHQVSWGDLNMINLEIKAVSSYIKNKDFVLDAGCSNGYSTFKIAANKQLKVHAFDYSEESIRHAVKAQYTLDRKKKITFSHGNLLNIDEPDNTFDVAYTIRVLINLLSWKMQKKAILELHRVLKPGGLLLVSETFIGSLNNLNKVRALAGLNPIVAAKFNLPLSERKLEKFVKGKFSIVEINKFSSIYYLASRFLRYLTMEPGQRDTYINPINNFFAKFPVTTNSGDFGLHKLYVLKKE